MDQLIGDGISIAGLRWAHVIRVGGPVNVNLWVDNVQQKGGQISLVFEYEEEDLGIHHLKLYWRLDGRPAWAVELEQRATNGGKNGRSD